ncbi:MULTISPECIES: cobyrinate a,c-diamide synthase [Aerococcus]|nr:MULTISPECIES: cobyrinate a,c-diamide synthase [Aerococcus]KAA9234841.1 cobyrinate a,c-diamide synthase [Aerococcus mictus]MDK6290931.1 cobyrinate a,c-diamide synthase [Aerococcus urinae]MDK6375681.1 cobyrinate a,c-diamide synthase [Aerococcus urinae]MDK8074575.1 cobyrinate a,c-diamide synthase [Aerococcus urinae]MDK8084004.1 cobyrinate a,c-diamide synthase [Aerococcus urinae]
MRALMIAGATSNVGKTTLTLGLIQALIKRGLKVQPYKVGPDYIDTRFHQEISHRPSINLDQFLVPDNQVLKALYTRHLEGSDIAVVEGVMGLFDGFGSDALNASSAGIAKALDIPILLVIDGRAMSTSAAAMVKGYLSLIPDLNIIGILVNRVASASHYQLIKNAIERYNQVPVLGYLARNEAYSLPSRHLGLVLEEANNHLVDQVSQVAQAMEESIAIDDILNLSQLDPDRLKADQAAIEPSLAPYEKADQQTPFKVAYAYDEAFSFYYPDNLSLLEKRGGQLQAFSPLHDQDLPEADLYYIGGGFPELYAETLSENQVMRTALLEAHKAGKAILAECGGLMYLGSRFIKEDKDYPMVGIFEGQSQMTDRLRRFGYCTMALTSDSFYGQAGDEVRGHEFHYSTFTSSERTIGNLYKDRDGKRVKEWQGGFQKGKAYAAYQHVHFYQDPKVIDQIISWIKED